MRIIAAFPTRSGHDPQSLLLQNPSRDYASIRSAANQLLEAGHITDLLPSTYCRLLVDEYQDCNEEQHRMVRLLSGPLPTCVLGDPLQAIFGFGDDALAAWESDVLPAFPLCGRLSKPWRWTNAQSDALGEWLLSIRPALAASGKVDLREAPAAARWVELAGDEREAIQLEAAATDAPAPGGTVLIVAGNTRESHHWVARHTPNASVVEPVDLRDLMSFAATFDPVSTSARNQLYHMATTTMTKVTFANLNGFVAKGRTDSTPKSIVEFLQGSENFNQRPSFVTALALIAGIARLPGVRSFRPTLLRALGETLRLAAGSGERSLYEIATKVREDNRMLGRPLPARAVGSTLLLKGLEADMSVVLGADSLTPQNLYVALTRGSRSLVVCASSPLLPA